LEHLKGLTNLKKLNVTNCGKITMVGARKLKEALPNLTIRPAFVEQMTEPEFRVGGTARRDEANPKGPVAWLNLGGAEVNDAGFGHHLKELPELRTIYLSDTQVTNAGLSPLAKQAQLRVLHLSLNRNVGDSGLAHLSGLTALEELHLTSTAVTDTGLSHLAGLTQLKTLSLGRTKIAGTGLSHLAGMSRLESLDLCETPLMDGGLAHIGRLASLEYLWLEGTRISDEGLGHLKGLTGLKTLDLRHTSVGDKGLKQLLGSLTNLRRLSLEGTRATEAGIEELRSALPKVDVRH
jgi:internalin A